MFFSYSSFRWGQAGRRPRQPRSERLFPWWVDFNLYGGWWATIGFHRMASFFFQLLCLLPQQYFFCYCYQHWKANSNLVKLRKEYPFNTLLWVWCPREIQRWISPFSQFAKMRFRQRNHKKVFWNVNIFHRLQLSSEVLI